MIASRLALYIKDSQPLIELTAKQSHSESNQQEHIYDMLAEPTLATWKLTKML
jgi:hypothetical protein